MTHKLQLERQGNGRVSDPAGLGLGIGDTLRRENEPRATMQVGQACHNRGDGQGGATGANTAQDCLIALSHI